MVVVGVYAYECVYVFVCMSNLHFSLIIFLKLALTSLCV